MEWRFEEYVVGRRVVSPARTITEADVLRFAALTGDRHPLHTDPDHAATSPFGERIAHGLLGLGVAAGLLAGAGMIGPGVLALLGVDEWTFRAPIRLGESVRARASVRSARPSASQADRGIVTLDIEVVRGDDVVAQRGALTLLVRRRES